jgi:EAL domain-containing protein (putative c-di-GMP-specific phosphodiesterase class I)
MQAKNHSQCVVMARDFLITPIIESVESAEEHQTIKSLGANLCQGFYFFKPMMAKEFKELMTTGPTHYQSSL